MGVDVGVNWLRTYTQAYTHIDILTHTHTLYESALYSFVITPDDPRYIQATYNNYGQVMNQFG